MSLIADTTASRNVSASRSNVATDTAPPASKVASSAPASYSRSRSTGVAGDADREPVCGHHVTYFILRGGHLSTARSIALEWLSGFPRPRAGGSLRGSTRRPRRGPGPCAARPATLPLRRTGVLVRLASSGAGSYLPCLQMYTHCGHM